METGFKKAYGPFWLRELGGTLNMSKGQCSPETIQSIGRDMMEYAEEWERQIMEAKEKNRG